MKTKQTPRNYRHGEIALIGITKLPEALQKSDSDILVSGSHGNHHRIDNGTFYPHLKGFVIGYLVAQNTCLLHTEHGDPNNTVILDRVVLRKVPIQNGIYEVRKQQEYINNDLKPVID